VQAEDPIPCYFGSVNRWECDENDHLNVRFYADKINQATGIYLREATGIVDLALEIRAQHIRFVQEARIATPIRVDCAALSVDEEGVEVLALMRHNLSGDPIAAFITRVVATRLDLSGGPVDVPDWAAPRGIDPTDPYPAQESLSAAEASGFQTMGRGIIAANECDELGRLLPHHYIGRISDGMPNLWAFMTDAEAAGQRAEGELGGAVVEYRLDFFNPLHSGDQFRQVSGIRALGNKTQHMVHMVLNETRGELAVRAEGIGVAMDLETRRAVPISEGRREQMKGVMLR